MLKYFETQSIVWFFDSKINLNLEKNSLAIIAGGTMDKRTTEYFLRNNMISAQGGIFAKLPIIYTEDVDGQEALVLRWFCGEGRIRQASFQLAISLEQIVNRLTVNPYYFRIVFIGQLKEAVGHEDLFKQAMEFFHGDMEKMIMFAVAPVGFHIDSNGFTVPVNFFTEVVGNIGSEEVGDNKPPQYCDWEVWRSARRRLNAKFLRPDTRPASRNLNPYDGQRCEECAEVVF